MLWPWPWPAWKFGVWLMVRRAEGLSPPTAPSLDAEVKVVLKMACKGPKVRWKGPRVCRNQTRFDAAVADAEEVAAVVPSTMTWEEFEDIVLLTPASHRKAAAFHPWELSFRVSNVTCVVMLYIYCAATNPGDPGIFKWMKHSKLDEDGKQSQINSDHGLSRGRKPLSEGFNAVDNSEKLSSMLERKGFTFLAQIF